MACTVAKVAKNPHHHSVCLVTAQYPTHAEGTGVLLDYKGHCCIVTGAYLVPNPVAACNAFVRFLLRGMPHPLKVSLRPHALFEVLGKRKSTLVIAACDPPIIPPLSIPPAVPAPADYTGTVLRFSRCGRLQSPETSATEATGGLTVDSRRFCTKSDEEGYRALNSTTQVTQKRRRHLGKRSGTRRSPKSVEGTTDVTLRRGAVYPGTRAYRHPNDPDAVEPFSITVEQDGVVSMEIVAHIHGRSKRTYRALVQGGKVGTAREDVVEGCLKGGSAAGTETGAVRDAGCLDGDGYELGEKKGMFPADGVVIAVAFAEKEPLDGVHGAPVFMGGKLFGFAMQERVGKGVTGVLPASTLGLLPPPSADMKPPPPSTVHKQPPRLLHDNANHAPGLNGTATFGFASSEQPPPSRIIGDTKGEDCDENSRKERDTREETGEAASPAPPVLLGRMIRLFAHGTPASLELELGRVGEQALRELRTPDGRTLAHLAAMAETLVPLDFVHRRLLMDVALEEVPKTGNTALHFAAYCGRVECVEYLVSLGGDATKRNCYGQTPAMLAVLTRQTGVLGWLLKNATTGSDPDGGFFEELLDTVEDMDEAAIYGSPTYRLLRDAFDFERPAGDGSDSDLSDDAAEQEIIVPLAAADVTNGTATEQDVRPSIAERPAPLEKRTADMEIDGRSGSICNSNINDFERAWKLYQHGKMDARGVLEVMRLIHGDRLDEWWPLMLAALPPDEPHLVKALDATKRDVDREIMQTATTARQEDGALRDGEGSRRLRSATAKYLRGSISTARFYNEMVVGSGTGAQGIEGRSPVLAGDAIVAKVARGMPEDKAWALMEAHRRRRHEERLNKKRFRKLRRRARDEKQAAAAAASRWKTESAKLEGVELKGSGLDTSPGAGDGDTDSSVATIFSFGGSDTDTGSILTTGRNGSDLNQAAEKYRLSRISAVEFKDILVDAFGLQVESVLPEVLATLSRRKRRELANLWRIDNGNSDSQQQRQQKSLRSTSYSGPEDGIEALKGYQPISGKVHGGTPSRAIAVTAAGAAVAGAEANGGTGLGSSVPPHEGGVASGGMGRQEQGKRQRGGTASVGKEITRGGVRKGGRDQKGRKYPKQNPGDIDDDLGPVSSKPNSPFTTRASAWAGEKGDDSDEGAKPDKITLRADGRGPRNDHSARRDGVLSRQEMEKPQGRSEGMVNRSGHGGAVGVDVDDDDDAALASQKGRTKDDLKDGMVSDAQRLTSEFAAGRLTTPHFFGAMMEEFGEQRLLAALPDILKILPKEKAEELEAFTSEAEGKAGASTKARRKQREKLEKDKLDIALQETEEAGIDREQQVNEEEASQARVDATRANKTKKGGKKQRGAADASPMRAVAGEGGGEVVAEEGDGGKKKNKKNAEGDGMKGVVMKREGAAVKNDETAVKAADTTAAAAATTADAEADPPAAGTMTLTKRGQRAPKKSKKDTKKEKDKEKSKNNRAIDGGLSFEDEDEDLDRGELFKMSAVERNQYDKAFAKLSSDESLIAPAKAAKTLSKSGLPRGALKRIWEMADVDRDEKLNKEEWAVAMHLVVCTTARNLPLPAKLPECLQTTPPHQGKPQRLESGAVGSNETVREYRQEDDGGKPKAETKGKLPPAVDLKRETKRFKNGDMDAESFLPILEEAFGKKELAKMWPKLLPTLPVEQARALAEAAGVDFETAAKTQEQRSPADPPARRQKEGGLKEATASFKKGGMNAREYHETALRPAFGDKLPEVLPNLLKALPPDRAAALTAVIEVEADEVRRLAEEAPQQWAMSIDDRRVYDNAFAKLDKDKNGFLSSAEARPMLAKAVANRLTESQLGGVWRMADIDGDGRLSREEWAIAFHIIRCVVKREMQLPSTLPEVLAATAGGRLPSV